MEYRSGMILQKPENTWCMYERLCNFHEQFYPLRPERKKTGVESASNTKWFGHCLHFNKVKQGWCVYAVSGLEAQQ